MFSFCYSWSVPTCHVQTPKMSMEKGRRCITLRFTTVYFPNIWACLGKRTSSIGVGSPISILLNKYMFQCRCTKLSSHLVLSLSFHIFPFRDIRIILFDEVTDLRSSSIHNRSHSRLVRGEALWTAWLQWKHLSIPKYAYEWDKYKNDFFFLFLRLWKI